MRVAILNATNIWKTYLKHFIKTFIFKNQSQKCTGGCLDGVQHRRQKSTAWLENTTDMFLAEKQKL